jgi:hypothetical protein
VAESESSAGATETSRATGPVEVGLIIRTSGRQVGDVTVDNHGGSLHINAACEDAGSDRYPMYRSEFDIGDGEVASVNSELYTSRDDPN